MHRNLVHRMHRNVKTGLTLAIVGLTTALMNTTAALPLIDLPAGFSISVFAENLQRPRLMTLAANGDLFVADAAAGRVYVLPDQNSDGHADDAFVFADGLNRAHALAFHKNALYVADMGAVWRYPYRQGERKASAKPEKLVELAVGGQHTSRTIVFGPDDQMYVATGSTCNVCEESDPRRASVWRYNENGKNGKLFAAGLRNAVGLEWHEGRLFATNNGRDLLGNDLPPESFFVLEEGKHYGWPYCYNVDGRQVWDRDFGQRDQAFCNTAKGGFATTTAHSAPLGLAFYTGTRFPSAYRSLMFVALHGSWNRSPKSGYKVVTVNPQTGEVRDFATGWLKNGQVFGRPADLEMSADGNMYLSDDENGLIYKISYK